MSVEYLIRQYGLQQGALEIQYIEEYFGEFPRKKTAVEIINRLRHREFLILMAEAPLGFQLHALASFYAAERVPFLEHCFLAFGAHFEREGSSHLEKAS